MTKRARAVWSLLGLTQEDEIDCDAFAARVASYVDGQVDDPKVVALLEHHRKICPECDEAVLALASAIGVRLPPPC